MASLATRKCTPCTGSTPRLTDAERSSLLAEVPGWALGAGGSDISRVFEFRDYHQTIAFVNAIAWIAHGADHHPDLEVSYKRCRVRYSTHATGGLSQNDFICAARVDALLEA